MNLPQHDLQHILDHTRDLWHELRGARLFITGGTGFFGRWLVESFRYANQQLDLKASVSILSREPASAYRANPQLKNDPAVTFYQGDVRSFEFPSGQYSHIIHAATDASERLNTENPLLMFDTIINGTRHMLDFAVHCNAHRFLFTSSGAVYGKQPSNLSHIPEDFNGAPDLMDLKSAYGIGKRTAEYLCTVYSKHHGLYTTIARGFAFVGPGLPLDTHFAIGNFIRDAIQGRPILIKGDGTPYRSYLYAADLAIWLWTILINGESCRPYNVGSDEMMTLDEWAHLVAEQSNRRVEVEILGKQEAGQSPERYVPDIQRAKNELGLSVHVSPVKALRQTMETVTNVKN